jgi:hypothetical protein
MSKDALVASPEINQKVYEDSEVRILKVEIKPGQKEALHIHAYKGYVVVIEQAKLRFYDEKGAVRGESEYKGAEWREPGAAHMVENIDTKTFKAFRIELKK